ncbi:MAG: GntR family transcriptional regulator [Sporichthyaceae bacterium]
MAQQEPRRLVRAPGQPLWAQLEADIRLRLARGEFAQGFPSEWTLVGEYGVSRHTVRQALRRIRESGVVETSQGRASAVGGPAIAQALGAVDSLFRAVERTGVEQRSTVRALELRRDAHAARALAIRANANLVFVERLRWAGDEPLALDRSWFPRDVGEALLDADLERASLYTELLRRSGVELTAGTDEIRAVVPDTDVRRLLRIPRGVVLLAATRLGRCGERPVELRETLIRADRYAFTAQWPGAAGYRLGGAEPLPRA